ncbi:putative glutathione S-transferase-related transmembrane protein [Granulicella sibirica]|uniref:Putative glutathione S-transferase-related transmembrane protein n=2 Tax=Granulicella sibirica TaxID=2479048 RepID=A0A4Q0T4P4_9BACT|nr:putative glutathione S-transferase-related transmembrane protein [Granulicella sibirica]
MPVCINEAKVGGKFRYEWTNGKGNTFHITGEYLELKPYNRIVHIERMHLPDPKPDNHIETLFEADGAGTLMTMRMTLPDSQTRTAMLATGMEGGMEASYIRLEGML